VRARIEANLIIHVEGDHFLDEQDVSQAVAGWLEPGSYRPAGRDIQGSQDRSEKDRKRGPGMTTGQKFSCQGCDRTDLTLTANGKIRSHAATASGPVRTTLPAGWQRVPKESTEFTPMCSSTETTITVTPALSAAAGWRSLPNPRPRSLFPENVTRSSPGTWKRAGRCSRAA